MTGPESSRLGQDNAARDRGSPGQVLLLTQGPQMVVGGRRAGEAAALGDLSNCWRIEVKGREVVDESQNTDSSVGESPYR